MPERSTPNAPAPEQWLLEGVRRLLRNANSTTNQSSALSRQEAQRTFSALHFIVPALLRRHYPAWDTESIDAIELGHVRAMTDRAIDLHMLVQLITTQTWAEANIRIELTADMLGFSRLECHVGQPGDGHLGLRPIPSAPAPIQAALGELSRPGLEPKWVFSARHDYGPSGFFYERCGGEVPNPG